MPSEELWGTDPDHPILPRSWEWEIIGLNLQLEPGERGEAFLDLMLKRGEERRLFRFWSPQDLEIERGGPRKTAGFKILDISSRGLERLGVKVTDFEGSWGQVHFLARTVEDRTGHERPGTSLTL